jgi:tetratricopeptide (TPR) repeat protein
VISALAGTAGVGKTALAVHWAHRARDQFPDGQLYVNLRGFDPGGQAMAPAEALRGFLNALEVSPQRIPVGLDAQAALYRSLLAGRRMLVVLDNARDPGQVRPLLPGEPGCLVLVTSRNRLTGLVAVEGAHPLTLDLLGVEEARELLAARLGADRVAAEAQAVEDVIASCARLPLALAIVAARAATHPKFGLAALAGELRQARGGLAALAGGDDPHSDLRAVFSWSYHTVGAEAARLFRLLGVHPGPEISPPAAASLTGRPVEQTRALLAELARANLVTEHTPGRYSFHDLLRAYATEQAHMHDSDDERRAATRRLLDHYLHTAHTAARLLNPPRDPITPTPPEHGVTPEHPADHQQALAWFAAEHPVLLAAVDHAAATGFDTHTWQLAWTLVEFLERRGHWHDWAATQQAAVAAARRLPDPSAEASAHRLLARAYTRLGRHDEAHTQLRQALDVYGQTGDQAGQAYAHTNLAAEWARQGRHAEALEHARRALDLFRATGHQRGQAQALNSIGWWHAHLGDHQQALASCQQALILLRELGDRTGEADTWDSIGYANHHLGHHHEAITCYHHALDLYRDLGDRYDEAETLTSLGETHHAAGDPNAARDAWRHALIILDDLDHPDADHVRARLHRLDQSATPTHTT